MKKLKLAVVGKDVSGSVSPQIHNFIAEREGYEINYFKLSVPQDEFDSRIEGILSEYDGLNFTIPYKLSIITRLKKLEGDAKIFGAVNTVNCRTRTGYNTDGDGFSLMLEGAGIACAGKRVLVLGAGGAGRSAAKKLAAGGAEVFIYDRHPERAEAVAGEYGVKTLNELNNFPCFAVINATGTGMHETEGVSPADEKFLAGCEVAIDLIYRPAKSEFLKIAERLGKKIMNGSAMLFYQAYFAECIFAGKTPSYERAKQLFTEFSEIKL